MTGAPWFKFFAKDFLAGVAEMSINERGQYITLLGLQWVNGSVPSDPASLRPILLGDEPSSKVKAKFEVKDGGRMVNNRLERERDGVGRARELAAKRKEKMRARRGGNANGTQTERVLDANGTQTGCVLERSGSVSVSELPLGSKAAKRKSNTFEYPADFESFWEAYPKKKSKGGALKAWKKSIGLPDIQRLLEIIQLAKQTDEWRKDGGQFIKYPATWLNDRGWEDDYTPPKHEPQFREG